jgi:triacylglycerol lipase
VGNESATAASAFTAPTPRATPSAAPLHSPTPHPQASNQSSNPTFPHSLASLPSSFTTLLLSMVDSPAYFNLTSPYLANHFNPLTPDHPRVKYFSVAGRMQSVSVWHPFWLPKLVLDGVEAGERERAKKEWEAMGDGGGRAPESKSRERPLWARDEAWGNDGLVPVQSAKWGEFLGIMEGCDHWELRGARGIAGDLNVDLSIGEGWGLRDWGGLVRAFKRDERRPSPAPTTQGEKEQVDADIKSSTDRLSAVFDWIVEHVPQAASPAPKAVATKQQRDKERRNELGSKADLERFYVALSRKLYDEGL